MKDRREYYKTWRKNNPDSVKKHSKELNKIHNKRYAEDPEYRAHWKRVSALQRYKMSPAEYDKRLEEQGGHCALCDVVEIIKSGKKYSLHVDHDHKCCRGHKTCGKCNRGILCANCNLKLGFLEQTMEDAWVYPMISKLGSWTSQALQYLAKYEKEKNQNDSE